MSSLNNALRVPTLPIEIWFEIEGSYTWDVSDEYIRLRMKERKIRRFAGREYLNALLEIATPKELGRFVDKFGCPIRQSRYSMTGYDPDPVPGSKRFPPYAVRLDEFFEVQNRLREAMFLPASKLLSLDEVTKSANPDTFDIKVERRKGLYYGTMITQRHPNSPVPPCNS